MASSFKCRGKSPAISFGKSAIGQPGRPPNGKPDEKKDDKKDGDKKDGDKDGKKDEEKKPDVITRPKMEKTEPVDTAELAKQVGEDGKVRFNLDGVPWPDLLQWLADASSLSLDWQELPADALNLRTQHPYTIEEAQDVINRPPVVARLHDVASGGTALGR